MNALLRRFIVSSHSIFWCEMKFRFELEWSSVPWLPSCRARSMADSDVISYAAPDLTDEKALLKGVILSAGPCCSNSKWRWPNNALRRTFCVAGRDFGGPLSYMERRKIFRRVLLPNHEKRRKRRRYPAEIAVGISRNSNDGR